MFRAPDLEREVRYHDKSYEMHPARRDHARHCLRQRGTGRQVTFATVPIPAIRATSRPKSGARTIACTGGEDTVQVAPSATMGDDVEMLTSADGRRHQRDGEQPGPVARSCRRSVFSASLPLQGSASAWKVLDGPIGEVLDKQARKRG